MTTKYLIRRRSFVSAMIAVSLLPLAAYALGSSRHMEVWKTPTCGCCKQWIAIVEAAGFRVTVHDSGNTAARRSAGVASKYGSCHTALIDGYAIEGHVPVREIERLLKERPNAIGLAVPGMPMGSPGMEQGTTVMPYAVLLLTRNGDSTPYAKYG